MVDVSDSDIRCTRLCAPERALRYPVPEDERFTTYLLEVKSDTDVGKDLAMDPVNVLGKLVEEEIDETWTVTVSRVNADIQIWRVHRFELWIVIEGKKQAHGMIYKLKDPAANAPTE
jgi:hypothetical protein